MTTLIMLILVKNYFIKIHDARRTLHSFVWKYTKPALQNESYLNANLMVNEQSQISLVYH